MGDINCFQLIQKLSFYYQGRGYKEAIITTIIKCGSIHTYMKVADKSDSA